MASIAVLSLALKGTILDYIEKGKIDFSAVSETASNAKQSIEQYFRSLSVSLAPSSRFRIEAVGSSDDEVRFFFVIS